jgi:hypothetical protein
LLYFFLHPQKIGSPKSICHTNPSNLAAAYSLPARAYFHACRWSRRPLTPDDEAFVNQLSVRQKAQIWNIIRSDKDWQSAVQGIKDSQRRSGSISGMERLPLVEHGTDSAARCRRYLYASAAVLVVLVLLMGAMRQRPGGDSSSLAAPAATTATGKTAATPATSDRKTRALFKPERVQGFVKEHPRATSLAAAFLAFLAITPQLFAGESSGLGHAAMDLLSPQAFHDVYPRP